MKKIQSTQCPNCWGFQEYDEAQPDNKICDCKSQE